MLELESYEIVGFVMASLRNAPVTLRIDLLEWWLPAAGKARRLRTLPAAALDLELAAVPITQQLIVPVPGLKC